MTESIVQQTSDELFVAATRRWDRDIPVCWEPLGNSVSGSTMHNVRNWAQDAVMRRWGRFSVRKFTGWGNCPLETEFYNGVRVRIIDGRASAYGLGTENTGIIAGVKLSAEKDASGNPVEKDVRETAVHEFGHVLGYDHEQERSDTPEECLRCTTDADCRDDPHTRCIDRHCRNPSVGGDTPVGVWDRHSVMSYCGALGEIPTYTDIVGHQQLYAKPTWLPGERANVAVSTFAGSSTGIAYVAQDGGVRFGSVGAASSIAEWVLLAVPNSAPPGGGIQVARRGGTGILDVFYFDNTGALRVSSRSAAGTWSTAIRTPANTAPPGARIAVGDSQAHTLDIFYVGNNGAIKQQWSDNNYGAPVNISSAGLATPGAGITAALETTALLDVFVVGTNGAVRMVQGNGNSFGPSTPYTLSATNLAPSGAPLTAVQVGDGDLNVYLVGNDGAVKNVYFFFGMMWLTADASATGFAPPGGTVGATPVRSGNKLDVFVVRNDGAMYNSSQTGSMGSWTPFTIASPVGIAAPGAPIAATSVNDVITVIKTGLGRSALAFGGGAFAGAPFY